MATENTLWLPPLSPKDQEKLNHLQKKQRKAIIKETGFSGKTLWDWLQLLIVPLMLALVSILFSIRQDANNQQQHKSDQEIAVANRQNDMQIALDQQRETTLKTYLDDMSDLLLNHHLRISKPGEEPSQVARERTITTLRRLDAKRNGIVLQFLQDAHLIGVPNAVVDLSWADLDGDDLSNANLVSADLHHTNLIGADLIGADLTGADLTGAILDNANLTRTNLSKVNLSEASLFGADLHHANLSGVDLSNVDLRRANLSGAILPTIPTIASPTPQLFMVTSANGLDVRAEPTRKSAIIAHYPIGTVLYFVEVVNGEDVDGNSLWGRSKAGHYFWLGGTDRPNG